MSKELIFAALLACSLTTSAHTQPAGSSEAAADSGPKQILLNKKKVPVKAKTSKDPPAKPVEPWIAADPDRAAIKPKNAASPESGETTSSNLKLHTDSIDYGMKAHGAAVSQGQTRDQNQLGAETGIGGQVGMKIPFDIKLPFGQ